jgi:hypothetical protein
LRVSAAMATAAQDSHKQPISNPHNAIVHVR